MVAGPDLLLQAAQGQLTAAWVQAVGSLAAIALAIYVPFRIDKLATERQKTRDNAVARSIALDVLPELRDWRSQIHDLVRTMEDTGMDTGILLVDGRKVVAIPDGITLRIRDFAGMGQSGALLQAAVRDAIFLDTYFDDALSIARGDFHEMPEKDAELAAFRRAFATFTDSVDRAFQEIQDMFPEAVAKFLARP